MRDLIKIIRFSWDLKKYYLAIAFLVLIVALLNQGTPFLLKYIVDGIVQVQQGHGPEPRFFTILVGLILVVNLLIGLIDNVSGYLGDMLGVKLNTLLSQRYYDHILKLPIAYFDAEVSGKITSRLDRTISTISELVQSLANFFITSILTVVITLGILLRYSWPTALLLVILFPLYMWLTTLSSKAWQQKQEGINQDTDYSKGRFVEAVGQIRVVKAFVQEKLESRVYAQRRHSILRQARAQSVQWHRYDVLRRSGLNLIFFLIYAFIIYQTYLGHYTLGTMTLILQLVLQAQFPLFGSSWVIENIQKAVAGSRDYFQVMETRPDIIDRPGARPLTVKTGHIQYRGVDFGYKGGQRVLNDVSFTIAPGTKLALVGESGEGKSTIANLLLRFYEPSGGQILIDGQDIAGVSQTSLRGQIACVFQDPSLFSGTVTDNIAYSRPDAAREDIEAAAKAANAHDFITKLPGGYNTQIGERGIKLSGGQKQRVAIARAILKNAPILILDEATSSLDSKAEREVQDALEHLMRGRTSLIIAHRLSTIQNVDRVVGLQGGRVIESGSPAELAKGKGIYAELLALQTPTKANKAKLKKYDIAKV